MVIEIVKQEQYNVLYIILLGGNDKMSVLYKNKGITLIALVVTIIVLLIMAGISISMLTGSNGVLEKAVTAKVNNELAELEEKIKLEISASYNLQGNLDMQELKQKLQENLELKIEDIEETVDEEGNITGIEFSVGDYHAQVDKNGVVDVQVKKEVVITGTPVDPNNPSDPNKSVTYNTTGGINQWLPYYDDGNNVYLISSDYLDPSTNKLNSSTRLAKASGASRSVYWTSAPGGNIPTYNNTSFWLKWELNLNNNTAAMQACASLINPNYWTDYTGTAGEAAIGGPTIEMVKEASLARDSSATINYSLRDNQGWYVEGTVSGTDPAFYITDTSKCVSYWMASPNFSGTDRLCVPYTSASVSSIIYNNSSSTYGLRPVIKLKEDYKIRENEEGIYEIYNNKTNKTIKE